MELNKFQSFVMVCMVKNVLSMTTLKANRDRFLVSTSKHMSGTKGIRNGTVKDTINLLSKILGGIHSDFVLAFTHLEA